MKTVKIVLLVVCFAMCGCSAENMMEFRKIAKDCSASWPATSGVIGGLTGHRQDEYPEHVVAAIIEMNELTRKINSAADPNEISDYELGRVIGLRGRILGPFFEGLLREYLPDMVDLVPLLF